MRNKGLGELVVIDRRWAQTGEGAILSYRAENPRGGMTERRAGPVAAIPEDEIVMEKA